MSQVEVEDFMDTLIEYKEEIVKDENKGRLLLIKLGIITEEGVVNEAYKDVCIPLDQD